MKEKLVLAVVVVGFLIVASASVFYIKSNEGGDYSVASGAGGSSGGSSGYGCDPNPCNYCNGPCSNGECINEWREMCWDFSCMPKGTCPPQSKLDKLKDKLNDARTFDSLGGMQVGGTTINPKTTGDPNIPAITVSWSF